MQKLLMNQIYNNIYSVLNNSSYFQDYLYEVFGDDVDIGLNQFSFFTQQEYRIISKLISKVSNANVLEVGCGYGGLAADISKKLNCNVFAIDLSCKAIDYAKDNYINLDCVKFSVENMDDIDLQKNTYDVIYSIDVVQNTNNTQLLFEKFMLALKDTGYLIISTWVDLHKYNNIEHHPYLKAIESKGFKLIDFIEPDPNLNNQKTFYNVLYNNWVEQREFIDDDVMTLMMNEAIYLNQNNEVSRFMLVFSCK